jgi:8-oxo-dGTP pyrophosphatase MutT (NUDIX family)
VAVSFPRGPELAEALRRVAEPALAGADLEAAVLLCLHAGSLLLVRRATREGDKWSGHVGLPGGRHGPGERLRDTALRETREELGFAVEDHGRVVGALGVLEANHRRDADTRIAMFVAELDRRPPLVLSDEIVAAHWVALDALVLGTASVLERPDPVPAYRTAADGRELVVWGITFRILEHLRTIGALAGSI